MSAIMRFLCILVLTVFVLRVEGQITSSALASINSGADEKNPILSPDGNTLYFTVAGHTGNVDGKRDPGDIWISVRTGDSWSAPMHGGAVLNDKAYNAVAGFSPDGAHMILSGHYAPGGIAKTQGIAISRKTATGWSTPENVSIPYYQNKSSLQSGFLSRDGNLFVYSAETYGSYGVEDIYVCRKNSEGKWTEPKNLGSIINTPFQELTPSLSDDGMTLYFSTNGRKGYGSFDIFSATRLDDTWINWTQPENLGATINSSGRELFYRVYPTFSLYTSTKDSDGYGDMKFYQTPEEKPVVVTAQPPLQEPTPETKEPSTPALLKVFGRVTNAKTNSPVVAMLTFESDSLQENTSALKTGDYAVSVVPAQRYRIKIEAPGYVSIAEQLDAGAVSANALEMNFTLQPVEVGTTVNLKHVLFAQSKAELLPESFRELDQVVEFLQRNPTVAIELAGHTDNRGVHSHNVKLSQARVNAVKNYLVSKGISPKRITGKGYGGLHPIADNDNPETRILNRRVEFVIKKL
jgi:OOP family OmpA-OmpF porin